MRVVIGGCGIGRSIVSAMIENIRGIQFSASWEQYQLPIKAEYCDPTPYKMKPYRAPRVNRALHRQSVNRGK
ncbi:hypothetical protein ECW2_0091 [Enterobacter phage EC-W2]|nr:hypothetical protein ECW2_0091 [Enterobacter phage EC-W2]